MKRKQPSEHRASYVVVLDTPVASDDELRDLAAYLSTMRLRDCDVVVLDHTPRDAFDHQRSTLRWVARHVAVGDDRVLPGGRIDAVRAATDFAACEKVVVATEDVRYSGEALDQIVQALDVHEVVEPQDYFDPLPWWGGIETGRILVHRAIEPSPGHGATFGFRRSAMRALRGVTIPDPNEDPVRRLASRGAEVYAACDVFVRRRPQPFDEWLGARARIAGADFGMPMKTAFFFALVPLLLLLAVLGDARLAGGYAGMIAFASAALAVRGRSGATRVFPLRTCLFAPLWILERSLSVYWALARKLREEASPAPVQQQGEGNRAQRVG